MEISNYKVGNVGIYSITVTGKDRNSILLPLIQDGNPIFSFFIWKSHKK